MSNCETCLKYGTKKFYCSDCCQRSDWSGHKALHKAIQQAAPGIAADEQNYDEDKNQCAGGEMRYSEIQVADTLAVSPSTFPLMSAAAEGRVEKILILLRGTGGKRLLFAVDKIGRTELHLTANSCQLEAAQELIKAGGKELAVIRDNEGHTAIHAAAHRGVPLIVQLLIEAGGRDLLFFTAAGGTEFSGFTALQMAATADGATARHLAVVWEM